MAEHTIKMPDVGEGVAEAELVEWHVKVGDPVREDAIIAAVMTDKATVEIPSPVEGTIAWLGADIGDTVAVGAALVRIEIAGTAAAADERPETEALDPAVAPATQEAPEPVAAAASHPPAPQRKEASKPAAETARKAPPASPPAFQGRTGAPRPDGERPLAPPAVRLRAREAGVDLRQVAGTGPAGRITHDDLDAFIARGSAPVAAGLQPDTSVEEVKVVGLRRRIAEKMQIAKARIPHITYIEEVDVTALEELRGKLNAEKRPAGAPERPKLTILPFLARAIVKAVAEQPQINALYDDEAGIVHRHGGVHIGIAAQTPGGLVVPVLRHAEARTLWDSAAEIGRLAEAARSGTATREELSGSTITITSLGALGGVATTPVINHPEVAIVGVNKMMIRPIWDGAQFVPRKMMNLSSSFDHRVVDGWDAAVFVQRLKALLETPALLFVE
jgi:2-oxoisovalerate dehydrogenase E2 component (dihydrolipoyl transacylase)